MTMSTIANQIATGKLLDSQNFADEVYLFAIFFPLERSRFMTESCEVAHGRTAGDPLPFEQKAPAATPESRDPPPALR